MIKKNLFFAIVAGLAFTIASCGGGNDEAAPAEEQTATETIETTQEAETTETVETAELAYYCPMKCEGETTYKEPGKCSVCGMDLVANQ